VETERESEPTEEDEDGEGEEEEGEMRRCRREAACCGHRGAGMGRRTTGGRGTGGRGREGKSEGSKTAAGIYSREAAAGCFRKMGRQGCATQNRLRNGISSS